MGFTFDKKQLTAVDSETGAKIRKPPATGRGPLGVAVAAYEDRKISFEFYIMPIYRNIGVELADGVKQKRVEVAVYIDQSSVQRGLNFTLRAKGRPSLSDVASSQFLKQLKEGIFVWATWGGARVDFVPSRKDLNAVLQPGEMRMGQAGP